MINKFKALPIVKRLNQFDFMAVIWWSLLTILIYYLARQIHFSIILGVGVFALIVNCVISYHLGKEIKRKKLKQYWLLCLPLFFCLTVLPLPSYSLIFGLIYLIFEIFGFMEGNVYR